MESYPSGQDYKSIVEEKYGRDKAQDFFRRHSHVLVHSSETEDLANLTRRMYLGYDRTTSLKEDVLEKGKRKKATAFIFETKAEEEDLIEDLDRSINTGYQYNENKQLEVQSVSSTDDGFDINLQYEDRSPSRRPSRTHRNARSRSRLIRQTMRRSGREHRNSATQTNSTQQATFSTTGKLRDSRNGSRIKRINFDLEMVPSEDSVRCSTRSSRMRRASGDLRKC